MDSEMWLRKVVQAQQLSPVKLPICLSLTGATYFGLLDMQIEAPDRT